MPCNLLWDKNNVSKEYDEIALICPESWFPDRSNCFKDGKDKHQEGIVPFSKFPRNHNHVRFENPVILLGRGPSNLLCERSKWMRCWRFESVEGSSPSILLSLKCNSWKLFDWGKASGIGVGAAYYGLRPVVEFMTFNFSMQVGVYLDCILSFLNWVWT